MSMLKSRKIFVMDVAETALEMGMRYLASSLGRENIRYAQLDG
ncbi:MULTISPECIES: hypothetical protein [Aneurinibacillus]|uniref:Uncharacterized protein n=1 Tax=Aneurinibacillus thermoaerophilus TaxID=143495 RepID=A0A1G7W5P9_ANETH|nr:MULTISPECIES: hypothetical protein [Aneurinibacillus]MED0675580.1 hypothetical protein [Aneurinibacillus thermoaerophilus]MED0681309.1 hypothetical protein [Aneurinibacillus thermoaerophilus]MED0735481.1 hypothetical protein [Aneurinibacillus thermoaerophilus]MED0756635.1 hypothetical protein [Aneurinibacillus thermoaerophilus]MED0760685.1 hypothetical protein [Aneurinibacillus thermoaerophilus]